MSRLLKLLVRLSLVVIGLFAILSVILIVLMKSSLPDYDRSHRVTGIDGPVEIIRNNYNVPHIFGTTDADAYFGLGFVHAQDRLWQMIINRQFVQGRLSEIFGARTLNADKLMHNLELYPLARETLKHQDAYTQTALAAYAAGVNAWMNYLRDKRFGRGAPEFYLFDAELRPWTPVDSLALLSLNAFDLSPHLNEEVLRHRLIQRVPLERARELLPIVGDLDADILPLQTAAEPARTHRTRSAAQQMAKSAGNPVSWNGIRQDLPVRNRLGASNGWGILPQNSSTGGALLANDPHLGFSAPSTWMLARLELSSGGIIGATVPGIPLILLGRSAKLAWGLTYSYLDDQDLYFEKLYPTSSDRYLTPTGYKDFERRVSVIAVKDEQP
ncbi:MAG: penicillin acylase family protein, partial [Rhodobacteraceae bacterium]|nr:penicillin acylase family protein [Paracoccaceae bacterium]